MADADDRDPDSSAKIERLDGRRPTFVYLTGLPFRIRVERPELRGSGSMRLGIGLERYEPLEQDGELVDFDEARRKRFASD